MKNIFVGNLSFGVTEASVRSLFETHGTVDRVNICTDRDSGQPRGFGFVEMSEADAEKAAKKAAKKPKKAEAAAEEETSSEIG